MEISIIMNIGILVCGIVAISVGLVLVKDIIKKKYQTK